MYKRLFIKLWRTSWDKLIIQCENDELYKGFL
jgi:hypothetical protein